MEKLITKTASEAKACEYDAKTPYSSGKKKKLFPDTDSPKIKTRPPTVLADLSQVTDNQQTTASLVPLTLAKSVRSNSSMATQLQPI